MANLGHSVLGIRLGLTNNHTRRSDEESWQIQILKNLTNMLNNQFTT